MDIFLGVLSLVIILVVVFKKPILTKAQEAMVSCSMPDDGFDYDGLDRDLLRTRVADKSLRIIVSDIGVRVTDTRECIRRFRDGKANKNN